MDDIVYTSSSEALINQFKAEMMRTFDMSDLGELNYFLGLEVIQRSYGIFIRQKRYIEVLLHQLNMTNCKSVLTPMSMNDKAQGLSEDIFSNAKMYRNLVGKVLYLTHSWPDICFSVSYLSRFMNCPSLSHFSAAKRVLRYLAGTKELGLWFS